MKTDTVQIQPLRDLSEMTQAVELQTTYWGDDRDSVIPAHMLFSIATYGGHVLGATIEGELVGVLVGMLGTDSTMSDRPAMANLLIYSKRMVVKSGYRGAGIGYKLKVAQREVAIQQGIRLVVWTYDPLLAPNANLNVHKLGVICRSYRENYYGTDAFGGLAAHGASDRLHVEWWVTKNRVKERINGSRSGLTLAQYLEGNAVIVNPSMVDAQGFAVPPREHSGDVSSLMLVEIPDNFPQLTDENQDLSRHWRIHVREVLGTLIRRGYVITDFLREPLDGRKRAFYLLSAINFDE